MSRLSQVPVCNCSLEKVTAPPVSFPPPKVPSEPKSTNSKRMLSSVSIVSSIRISTCKCVICDTSIVGSTIVATKFRFSYKMISLSSSILIVPPVVVCPPKLGLVLTPGTLVNVSLKMEITSSAARVGVGAATKSVILIVNEPDASVPPSSAVITASPSLTRTISSDMVSSSKRMLALPVLEDKLKYAGEGLAF